MTPITIDQSSSAVLRCDYRLDTKLHSEKPWMACYSGVLAIYLDRLHQTGMGKVQAYPCPSSRVSGEVQCQVCVKGGKTSRCLALGGGRGRHSRSATNRNRHPRTSDPTTTPERACGNEIESHTTQRHYGTMMTQGSFMCLNNVLIIRPVSYLDFPRWYPSDPHEHGKDYEVIDVTSNCSTRIIVGGDDAAILAK